MLDWKNEFKPKMERLVQMLERSPLPQRERLSIKTSVQEIFLVSPKLAQRPGIPAKSVYIGDELVTNFDLREWQDLRRSFMNLI